MSKLGVTLQNINLARRLTGDGWLEDWLKLPRFETAEENWVALCLELAALPEDAPGDAFSDILITIRGIAVSEIRDAVTASRKTRALLREVLFSYPRKRRLSTPAQGPLAGVKVTSQLSVDAKGQLELGISLAVIDDRSMAALLAVFLDDPRLGIGKRLRRCELNSCNRLFISMASRGGGPRRKYCCDEHREKADREDAVNRVARMRKAIKRAKAHK